MKNKHYWKVVRVYNEQYTSCIILKGKFRAKYKVGQYIDAPIKRNGLLVFEKKKDAKTFIRDNGLDNSEYQIFKVEVRGKEITNPIVYWIGSLMANIKRINYDYLFFPPGTRCFPEVMLVKKSS